MANGGLFLTPQQALAAEAQMRQQGALSQGFTPVGASAQELGRSLAGAFGKAIGAPPQESPDVQLARTRQQAIQGINPTNPESFMQAAKDLYSAGDVEGAASLIAQGKSLVQGLEKPKFSIQEIKSTTPDGQDVFESWILRDGVPVQLFKRGNRKTTGTEIKNVIGGDDFYSQLSKDLGKSFVEDRKNAELARDSLVSSNEAVSLINSGVITGTGANFMVGLGKALQQAGLYSGDAVANTEAFQANMAKQTAQIITAFGAGTGLSDADREYAKQAAGGDIAATEESIRKIIDINNRAATNVINNFNKKATAIEGSGKAPPYPLTVELPEVALAETPAFVIPPGAPQAVAADKTVYHYVDGRWVDEKGNEYKGE